MPWPSLKASALWLVALISGFGASVLRPKGFDYPLVWDAGVLHQGGHTYTLYSNLGKGFAGLLLLLWWWPQWRKQSSQQTAVGASLGLTLISIGAIFGAAVFVYEMPIVPKFPAGIVWFFVVNLLFTVMPEEAFFRLLMQRQIARGLVRPWLGHALSISLVGVFFAVVHVPVQHAAFGLFLLAGLLYCLVFAVTQRYWMAVLCHFGVNVLHICLLPYPLA
ncbi:MAG: CPBP family intramembrane glutamic endopeptidase [Oleiphilaceae bacterium]|nr:CPBP family intramembrane glutamic endopeptidase [Oleiphilaceae bacterium]